MILKLFVFAHLIVLKDIKDKLTFYIVIQYKIYK